jgi:hypothetical protein
LGPVVDVTSRTPNLDVERVMAAGQQEADHVGVRAAVSREMRNRAVDLIEFVVARFGPPSKKTIVSRPARP